MALKPIDFPIPSYQSNIQNTSREAYSPMDLSTDLDAMTTREQAIKLAALNNALKEKYGARGKEADIGLKEAQMQHYKNKGMGGGTGSLTPESIQAFMNMASGGQGNQATTKNQQKAMALFALGDNKGGVKALFEQTPEEKLQMPTTETITANQKAIQSIDAALPLIKELIDTDVPHQWPIKLFNTKIEEFFQPGKQAKYKAKAGSAVETLIGAKKLPKDQESMHMVKEILFKRPGEMENDYKERLKHQIEELLRSKAQYQSILGIDGGMGGFANAAQGQDDSEFIYNPATGGFN